jgi:hypothetical protein
VSEHSNEPSVFLKGVEFLDPADRLLEYERGLRFSEWSLMVPWETVLHGRKTAVTFPSKACKGNAVNVCLLMYN